MGGQVGSSTGNQAAGWTAQCGDTQHVDRQEVAVALDRARRDLDQGDSALADVLRDPCLNEQEKDQVIRSLIDEGHSSQLAFFGHEAWRSGLGADRHVLNEDLQVIANALQGAYDRKVIGKDDLVKLAGAFGTRGGNVQQFESAQRFLAILARRTAAPASEGVAEALAKELWDHGGADRAAASVYYLSDTALASCYLGGPKARAEAMKALSAFNGAAANGLQRVIADGADPAAAIAMAADMRHAGLDAGGVMLKAITAGANQFKDRIAADVRKLAAHDAELTWLVHNCGAALSATQLAAAVEKYRSSKKPEWRDTQTQLSDRIAADGEKLLAQIKALQHAPPGLTEPATRAADALLRDRSAHLAIDKFIQTHPEQLLDDPKFANLVDIFTAAKGAEIGRSYANALASAYVRERVLSRIEGLDLSKPRDVQQATEAIKGLRNDTFRRALGVTEDELDKAVTAVLTATAKVDGTAKSSAQALQELDKTLNKEVRAFNATSLPGHVIRSIGLLFAAASVVESYGAVNTDGLRGDIKLQNSFKLLIDGAGFAQQSTELLMGVFAKETLASLPSFGGEWKLAGKLGAGETIALMAVVLDGIGAARAFGGWGVEQDFGNGVFASMGAAGSVLTVIGSSTSYAWLGPVGMGVSAVAVVGKSVYDGVKDAHKYEDASRAFLKAAGYNDAAATALSRQTAYAPFGISGSSPLPFLARYAQFKGVSPERLRDWINGLQPDQMASVALVMREIATHLEADARRFERTSTHPGAIDLSAAAVDRALNDSGISLPKP